MLGFMKTMEKYIYRKDNRKCPFCGKDMSDIKGMFRDKLSFKEFCISGLCQECQDKVFGK